MDKHIGNKIDVSDVIICRPHLCSLRHILHPDSYNKNVHALMPCVHALMPCRVAVLRKGLAIAWVLAQVNPLPGACPLVYNAGRDAAARHSQP